MTGPRARTITLILCLIAAPASAGCLQATEPDPAPAHPEPGHANAASTHVADQAARPPSSDASGDDVTQGPWPRVDPAWLDPVWPHLDNATTNQSTEHETKPTPTNTTRDTPHDPPTERTCTERPPVYHPRPPTRSPTQFGSPEGPRLHHELNDTHYRTIVLPGSATLCLDHVRISWGGHGGSFSINGIDAINGTRTYYCAQWYDSPNHCGADTEPYPLNATGYRLVVFDRDGDGHFGPGDGIVATYDGNTTTNTFDDPMPRGPHAVQIDHTAMQAYRDWNGHDWLLQPHLRITSEPSDTTWNLTVVNEAGTERHAPTTATLTIHHTTKLHIDLTDLHQPEPRVFYAPYPTNTTGEHPGPTHPTYATAPATGPALRISFHDADADGRWTIDDHILVQYDNGTSPDADSPRTWDDPFPQNTYFMRVHGANDTALGWTYGIVYPPAP